MKMYQVELRISSGSAKFYTFLYIHKKSVNIHRKASFEKKKPAFSALASQLSMDMINKG